MLLCEADCRVDPSAQLPLSSRGRITTPQASLENSWFPAGSDRRFGPQVSDGKVSLWKDYWDLNAIANTTWFQSSLAAADMSWVFDATGLV